MADYYGTRTGEQIDAAVTEVNNAGNSVVARLSGNGAPTSEIAARIGDLYLDVDTFTLYVCTSGGTWKKAYELPLASSTIFGGIKADPAQSVDTQPVRIDEDGKLVTAPGSGGSVPATTNLLSGNGASGIADSGASLAQIESLTADAWSSSATYAVGDLRIHNNILWKCLIANSGQEPSDGSTYWRATSVSDEVGGGMLLLWRNPAPAANFASQTLPLDLSLFRLVFVNFSVGVQRNYSFAVVRVGEAGNALCVTTNSNFKIMLFLRNLTPTQSGVAFTDCNYTLQDSSTTTANNYLVPYEIYGIK